MMILNYEYDDKYPPLSVRLLPLRSLSLERPFFPLTARSDHHLYEILLLYFEGNVGVQ
jgi:hypothetical protein